MRIYWYAPLLRPPSFATMPKGDFVEVQKHFAEYNFPAWAYDHELPENEVEHLSLKLVTIEIREVK